MTGTAAVAALGPAAPPARADRTAWPAQADGPVLPGRPDGEPVASVAQPAPGPSPVPETFDPTEVSPGLLGFVPVFLIALACVVLFLSLTRHLRRVTVRQAAVDAADAERAGGPGTTGPGTTGPGTTDPGSGRRGSDGPERR